MRLTCVIRHADLRFVRETQTFSQESEEFVVYVGIVHSLQIWCTTAALMQVPN
jgi:hypothetical protein